MTPTMLGMDCDLEALKEEPETWLVREQRALGNTCKFDAPSPSALELPTML